ncbi:MAG TPA: hypothetical protein VER08_09710 [Pyrinomonadaceae bacterium]|nr:hypothetical protein [Pyrinomonadaceae bacterium]
MLTPRRNFLKTGATATLFAGLCAGSAPSLFAQTKSPRDGQLHEVPYEAKTDPVFYYTKATFEPHLKTEFRVRAGVTATSMTLVSVADCARTTVKDGAEGECFSLMFRAAAPLSTVRTIHSIEHDALKRFQMFLVRTKMKDDPEGVYYEAVINRRQR